VERLLSGALPGCPKLSFGVVDVRDVVDLHLKAMLHPSANGERFLAISGDFMSMREIAETLKSALGKAAKRVPTRELPNWLLHLAALGDPVVKQILPDLGRRRFASSAKAQRMLNWRPRSNQEAILATAQSLLDLGLVKGVR
jgi:nucleoside-diphosphate-sugar epimerase